MRNANSHKAATRKLWPTEAGKFRDHLLRLDKDSFRVTITTVLLFQALMRVAGYAHLGFYDRATLLLAAAALPMMLIGTRIGNLLAGRVEQHVFNVSVALVLMVSGTALLLK